ncbi:MAG: hypothetical protein SVM80_07790 [Halobacteriota archaeon]|nr:hypothetical protein [Halobacteriota archaeon]
MSRGRILKGLVLCVVVIAAIVSGCLSPPQEAETMPENVQILQISPAVLKLNEGNSATINVEVANNGSGPLEDLRISSLAGFGIRSNASRNVATNKKSEEKPTATISALVTAPSFQGVPPNVTLTLTYISNGEKSKSVEIPVKVFPDAKLQFVSFAASEDRIRYDYDEKITTKKAGTIYVTFSVKNEGKTTISGDNLKVMVDVKEDTMGQDNEKIVGEAMALNGTSFTLSVPITVPVTAPNGETDVYVTLVTAQDTEVLDSKKLTLIVQL